MTDQTVTEVVSLPAATPALPSPAVMVAIASGALTYVIGVSWLYYTICAWIWHHI